MQRPHPNTDKPANSDNNWFFFTLLFIIIEYGRPQDVLPIGFLRPAMLANLILIYFIVREKKYIRYNYKQVRYIIYFILLLACYVPFARNNFFAWSTFKTMLLYMPFILSVIATVTTIERLRKLLTVLLILMGYVTYYCLSHGGVGSGNYFSDENDVSLYINMYLPFCFFLLLYEQRIARKILYLSGLIMGLFGIIISFSRGGFVGLLAIGAVIWLNSSRKVLSAVLIMLIGGIFYLSASEDYLKEMGTVTNTKEGTAIERIESWKAGWRMFCDNLLGVGGGNFMVRFPEYQGDYFKRGMWGRVAHSIWFTLIPELGVIGIFLYFDLLYTNIKDVLYLKRLVPRNNPDIQYLHALSMSLLASFAGYFASGSFLSVLYYPHYWYLIPVLISAVNIAWKIQASVEYSTEEANA